MEMTVGIELEGWVSDEHGPVNVLSEIGKNPELQGGNIDSDAGEDQIELITGVHSCPEDAAGELIDLRDRLPADWNVFFGPHRAGYPSVETLPWAKKERYDALIEGVRQEAEVHGLGEGWCRVLRMPALSATHITFGVDPWTPDGVFVINALNNAAPYIALQAGRHCGLDNRDHLAAWHGFCDPARLPSDRWFSGPEDMRQHFCALPQLLRATHNGSTTWRPAFDCFQCPDNSVALGTTWWLVRPKPGAVEFRALPAMDPACVKIMAVELHGAVNIIRKHPPTSREGAQKLFKRLAQQSWLFPSHSLSSDEWWRLFLR